PLDRGHAEEPADALRAGVVRSAELVAAPARLLREVRSAADADDRVRALQGRARHARGHRRPRRLVLRLDPVHARVQPHGPARGVRAVRIHEGRIANRIANRGSPLRRHARAPRLRGLRARAAVALARLAAEIRGAGRGGQGFAAVAVAAPEQIVLQQDLDGDGVIAARGERVTWRLDGAILRREAGGGAQPIINGVRALTLTYF